MAQRSEVASWGHRAHERQGQDWKPALPAHTGLTWPPPCRPWAQLLASSHEPGAGLPGLKPSPRYGLPLPGHRVPTIPFPAVVLPASKLCTSLPQGEVHSVGCPGGPWSPWYPGTVVGRGPPCPSPGWKLARWGGGRGARPDPNQVCQPGFLMASAQWPALCPPADNA